MRIAAEHISMPCAGHRVNGDAVLLRQLPDDRVLIAVIDALGHGPTAADIADRAVSHLKEAPIPDSLAPLMEDLSASLKGTRGAAAMVVLLQGGKLEGCGVGNVDLRVLGGSVPVVQSPGILGVRVRRFNVFTASVSPGARLVLFSDGISASVPVAELRDMDLAQACRFVLKGYRRDHDDATILVVDLKD